MKPGKKVNIAQNGPFGGLRTLGQGLLGLWVFGSLDLTKDWKTLF